MKGLERLKGHLIHPGPMSSGLLCTKGKLTFCLGDNLKKYSTNQSPSSVGDEAVMANELTKPRNFLRYNSTVFP